MLEIRISPASASQRDLLLAISLLQSFVKPENATHAGHVATISHADNPATGTPDAKEAFAPGTQQSTLDPAVAFAGGSVPNAPVVAHGMTSETPGNEHAPSIAGANPSSTALAATPGILANSSASVPSAPNTAAAGQVVAPHTANPAAGVEVDGEGLPWDERIHSSNRQKTAKGVWQRRRGVDDTLFAAVTAELRLAAGNGASPTSVPAPTVGAQVVESAALPSVAHAPNVDPAAAFAGAGVPAAAFPLAPAGNVGTPAAPVAIPTATVTSLATVTHATSAPAPISYPELAQKITAGLAAKTITQEQLAAACTACGIAAFPLLSTKLELVPTFAAMLGVTQ